MTNLGPDHLSELLDALQGKLEGELRAPHSHPVAKGDASEAGWLSMLKAHLPGRYQADRAFVIDSSGKQSDQIDIIIYDRQYSPLVYNQGGQIYVPAESVYAAIEVRPSLNRSNVEYAGQKAASVRQLERRSARVPYVEGDPKLRAFPRIISSLVCHGSDWNPPFGTPLWKALDDLPDESRVDLGCVLQEGAFEVLYDTLSGTDVEAAIGPRALVQFLMRLLTRLQRLGTVPAMDYGAYLAHLQTPDSIVKIGPKQK